MLWSLRMSYIFQKIMYSFRKKIINCIRNLTRGCQCSALANANAMEMLLFSFFKAAGSDPVGTGTTISCSLRSWNKPVLSQGILKGEVSLYHWPPVWLVWNRLYDNWQFLFLFAEKTKPVKQEVKSTVIPSPLVFPGSAYLC